MKCSYVFEIVQGKDYGYCESPSTHYLYGVPVCDEHGNPALGQPIVSYPVSNVSVVHPGGSGGTGV